MTLSGPDGYSRTLDGRDQPAAQAAAKAADAAAASAAHVPLTKAEFGAQYAHITCPSCRRTAINYGDPNYNYKEKCTHTNKGGTKKRSRRLRRGKSKSKFQRRGKSVKRQRRY